MIYIILPTFNEEKGVKDTLNSIFNFFEKNLGEKEVCVLIIDDGSTDGTKNVLIDFANKGVTNYSNKRIKLKIISHEKNKGLGMAIKTGMEYSFSKGLDDDIVITMDADNTQPIDLVEKMYLSINQGKDVIIGSRYKKESSQTGVPFVRKLISFLGGLLFKITFPIKNVRDYTSGFRAFKLLTIRNAYNKHQNFFSEQGFTSTVDILLKLKKINKNVQMDEVSMSLRYDLKKDSSKMAVLKTIFNTLRLLMIRRIGIL
tara:strand:- start:5093 stop:5866 length:774 start_codon:yes stop_codon:yes gene_type:complete